MTAMATNKYEDSCTHCQRRVPAGEGVLRRGKTGWLTYCPEEAPDPKQPGPALEARSPSQRRHTALAAFVHARLDEDIEATANHGTVWRHRPARSGRVIDDHDEEIVQTWRYLADHLEQWNPNRVWANVESRRLIVDLFEAAATGSPDKTALGDAVKALAMAYRDHPEFDPAWLLREW